MAKTTAEKLAYQKAYNAKPEEAAKGVERRRTRRHMIAEGTVAIGDGKDISHKVAMENGGKSVPSNLKVQDASKNRDWRKGAKGYKVGVDK